MVNRLATVNTSRTLKVVGIILIVSFLVDILILSLPPKPTDSGWLIGLITGSVDRGIVPLVGLGMLFAGHWVDSFDDSSPSGIDLRFPALILSAILGLVFLVFFPLHLNSVKQISDRNIAQVNARAEQAENQVQAQLQQVQARLNTPEAKAQIEKQKAQIKAQFSELLKDDTKYKEALASNTVPQPQKELLKQFKADPKALDAFIDEQSNPEGLANQRLSQIRGGKEAEIEAAKQSAWKSGLRVSISSLLLSIGYIIIGWTGLKSKGATSGGAKRKATAR
ncbi:HpsJ family protein [Calothrix sp. CCY 0018]|uniref:hormogonium polysaccharide biosynthesis protein HpsJ n=1 Tax=Calothrix sp. CCY 0018 TaxID=3103864 RepID=UPI0039C65718